MKNIIYCIFQFIFVISSGCSNPKEKSDLGTISNFCDSLLNTKPITKLNVAVYEANNRIYPILDSVLNSEISCNFYNNCTSGFIVTISKNDNVYFLEINSANIFDYNYSHAYGIFIYKNHTFICNGLIVEELIQKTSQVRLAKFWKKNRNQSEIELDDRFSTWYFQYKENIIICLGHHLCY